MHKNSGRRVATVPPGWERKIPDGLGAVVLAGGKSLRMGRDKARMELSGETFLSLALRRTERFCERLLSVANDANDANIQTCNTDFPDIIRVADEMPGEGPIAGLVSALGACRSEALLALALDTPLVSDDLISHLVSFFGSGFDAYAFVDRTGWVHPMPAIYSKSALPVLKAQIEKGDRSLFTALNEMRVKWIPLSFSAFDDSILANVNTPAEYEALVSGFGMNPRSLPPVIAVCGVKNSGKTTLLTGVLPLLTAKGLKVAAIKHDAHDFTPDVPGTDSYRMKEAGATGVAVFSPVRYMITLDTADSAVEDFLPAFAGADLIMLEGGKQTAWPKIEVWRKANSPAPVCDPRATILLCTDTDGMGAVPNPDMRTMSIDDYSGIAGFIADWICGQSQKPCNII